MRNASFNFIYYDCYASLLYSRVSFISLYNRNRKSLERLLLYVSKHILPSLPYFFYSLRLRLRLDSTSTRVIFYKYFAIYSYVLYDIGNRATRYTTNK